MVSQDDAVHDMARQWLAYDHCRYICVCRMKKLGGWFHDHHGTSTFTSPESKADDIRIHITGGTWCIHFRAGNEAEKRRVAHAFVDNVHRQEAVKARMDSSGFEVQVFDVIKNNTVMARD